MRGMMSPVVLRGLGLALAAALCALPAGAFEFHGMGAVSYTNHSADDITGSNNGFFVEPLDLYATERVDERTDVLLEIVIEGEEEGHFVSDLERLQVTYQFNNVHRLRAGRFHSLLGYWNREYHHGAHLHTTAFRPYFLHFEDEGGVLPTHAVGLWWSGRWKGGSGKLETGLMIHNGASIRYDTTLPTPGILDAGTGGDNDNLKTVAAMIAYQPAFIRGLEVGISGQTGEMFITDDGTATVTEVDQYITAVHAAWLREQTEFLAELFSWDHDVNGIKSGARAWYVQGGGRVGKSMLYMRYETLDADQDTYFESLGFTNGTNSRQHTIGTLGLRFDLDLRNAVKFELSQVDDDLEGTYDTASVQWSFTF